MSALADHVGIDLEPEPVGEVSSGFDGRTRDSVSAVIELRRRRGPSLWTRVDDEDYDTYSVLRWHSSSRGYAGRKVGRTTLLLHQLIVGSRDSGLQGDHINRDRLDNRRRNLRLATFAQNRQNVPHYSAQGSRFRGVSRTTTGWGARAGDVSLGVFATEDAAAVIAYRARRAQGSFVSEPAYLISLDAAFGADPTPLRRGDWNRIWSRETLLAAVHEWVARYGSTPQAADWSQALARQQDRPDLADRFQRDGCWPQVNTVRYWMGSWNALIAAAGFDPTPLGQRRPENVESWRANVRRALLERNGSTSETCKHGHRWDEHAYVIPKTGRRVCRACDSRRHREWKARKQQAATA